MPTVKHYLSLIKFSHTIFAMPFAMIGFFLGLLHTQKSASQDNNGPSAFLHADLIFSATNLKLLLLVVGCMVTARSAAMAFNRYIDREIDALNPRTAIREIPQGIIKPNSALLFTVFNGFVFIIITFFINSICFFLSPVALLVILGYSYTKRFTSWCHLVLGLGLSLAPIGAYLAVKAAFAWPPIFLSLSVLTWVSGFDIIYALQDESFDAAHQLYSIPSRWGKAKALIISRILHFISAGMLALAGAYGEMGLWYWIGLVIFCALLWYQHQLVSPTDLSRVNLAFMTTNGIASVVFAIFVITDLFY